MANFTQSTSIEAAAMEQGVPDRETFRRFRKRRSSTGMPSISGIEDDFDSLQNSLSTRKVVEAVKEEHSPEGDKGLSAIAGELHKATGSPHIPLKSLHDDQRLSTPAKGASPSFKVKQEPEEISDSGESSFSRFAFILQSALQGALPFPELILRFEACCKDLAEHVREEATERHRAIEDRLMRQKAQMLHDESATWSLIWHLYGKGPADVILADQILVMPVLSRDADNAIAGL